MIGAAAISCGHAQKPAPGDSAGGKAAGANPASPNSPDPRLVALAASAEERAILKSEGELLWKRWITGAGPLPSSAAAGHEQLYAASTLRAIAQAADASAEPGEQRALRLLHAHLAPQAVARAARTALEALEQARAQLAFAAPGDTRPERGERDLDRLLTEEPSPQKRAEIAEAEANAAAQLAPLALARDAAEERALAELQPGGWAALLEEIHGQSPAALAALAERTLIATEAVCTRALAGAAQRSLGVTADRLRRADLPRLVRAALADPQFPDGRGWENAKAALGGLGLDPQSLPPDAIAPGAKLLIDLELAPSKGARPLAVLIDPPLDVRLSLRPSGGIDEQRALLHETARAVGGALSGRQSRAAGGSGRWELLQLGDGSAAEGVAQLFEQLAGDPAWLRERTQLRGEPLDDLVHTEATRRILGARRAAALVLFEVRRREAPQTPEALAALYRGLLQRATQALLSDADAQRWPLEADSWLRAAVTLRAALLAASLELTLAPANPPPTPAIPPATPAANPAPSANPAPAANPAPSAGEPHPWWSAPSSATALRRLWSEGRSLGADEAATALSNSLDPAALARLIDARLSYQAPEKPPAAQRPDYKYMQGDRKVRKKKHGKKK